MDRDAGQQLRCELLKALPDFESDATLDRHETPEHNVEGAPALRIQCPDCRNRGIFSLMALEEDPNTGRFAWKCTRDDCRGYHMADHDGFPVGVPADARTRKLRHEVHNLLDKLYKGPRSIMSENRAREWMARILGRDVENAHVGLFDANDCKRIIAAIKSRFLTKGRQARLAIDMMRIANRMDEFGDHTFADDLESSTFR